MSVGIDMSNWTSLLKQTISTDSHGWICEANVNGARSIRIYSKEEYNALPRFSGIRKLTFAEIVSTSEVVLLDSFSSVGLCRATPFIYYNTQAYDLTYNLSVTTGLEPVKNQLLKVRSAEREAQELQSTLTTMSQRSLTKRQQLAEKTKNIWEKIKFFIWSNFLDDSKKIRVTLEAIKAKAPFYRSAHQASIRGLEASILSDMVWFQACKPETCEPEKWCLKFDERSIKENEVAHREGRGFEVVKKLHLRMFDEFPIKGHKRLEDLRESMLQKFEMLENLEKLARPEALDIDFESL